MLLTEILKDVKWGVRELVHQRYYHYSDEELERELSRWYSKYMSTSLDLQNPKTFNEKIQWLKLFDSTPLKAKLADKYACREWIADTIGEEYLVSLCGKGVYDSFDDIDFDTLPNAFVLKTTHGSSTNIIVPDKSKLNIREARMKMNRWMRANYGLNQGLELHYGLIPPRIVCETYLEDDPIDYKLFCFNGKPEFFWVDIGRHTKHHRNTYDLDWNELPFIIDNFPRMNVDRPRNLEKMIRLSERLSCGFAFVRVDFYEVNGKLYFGEMTFTSSSGKDKFSPSQFDAIYGEKLILPEKKAVPMQIIREIWR